MPVGIQGLLGGPPEDLFVAGKVPVATKVGVCGGGGGQSGVDGPDIRMEPVLGRFHGRRRRDESGAIGWWWLVLEPSTTLLALFDEGCRRTKVQALDLGGSTFPVDEHTKQHAGSKGKRNIPWARKQGEWRARC